MHARASEQSGMFSYMSLAQRVPASHPLRPLRALVEAVLASLEAEFTGAYSTMGRPSIAPEQPLNASALQIPFPIRSERMLVGGASALRNRG